MNNKLFQLVFILVSIYLVSTPVFAQEPIYSVFLIGDTGEPEITNSDQLNKLSQLAKAAGENSAVVFLGDNIYPKGMPDADSKGREEAEEIIRAQLETLKDYEGRVIVIPGNHDWQKGKKDGILHTKWQEEFVEDFMDSTDVYLPSNGCPGPVEISLNDNITLIIIDTQWVLHPWEKPRLEDGCLVQSSAELIDFVDDALKRNKDRKVIVGTHHPMLTYGIHGGKATLKDHLFPLTVANKNLYIPLPIIGSIYPFYRKYIGSVQDVAHPKNKFMRETLMSEFEKYPGLIHASGHEHSLQYSFKNDINYIVSGAGVKNTAVKQKGYAQFADDVIGFARVDYYQNGRTDLGFINAAGEEIYSKTIDERPFPERIDQTKLSADFTPDMTPVVTSVSDQFLKRDDQYWLYGENYRDVWATKVEVPVFDIGKEHGGLRIVQRGGGMQTRSLRLEDSTGNQYVLRSIRKYTEKVVPEPLRETIAGDLIQDQISASHPYGAFAVQYLAEAAGIYHTNPKMVFLPNDPRFGIYKEDFADMVALYEERPAGDRKDVESFGRSEKILSTANVLKRLYKDNDNYVDQEWVLKSRLFDLYIGDWDRHDDQWRWASFDVGKGDMYRPIPRDRDQAFFVSEGFIMGLVSKKWAMPKFQGFGYDLKYPAGFMFNARYFDRDFMSGLNRDDWVKQVRELQSKMTDDVIDEALAKWPDSVFQLSGVVIADKLKVRRSKLETFALDYYDFLSREVNVRGTNKKEFFKVQRMDNGFTRVQMYKNTDKNRESKLLYDRVFDPKETKEIRLYGLKGADEFEFTGIANKGIKTRAIGGGGKDSFVDKSRVSGLKKHTIVYDQKKGTKLELSNESKNKTSKRKDVNIYNRNDFKYDLLAPLVTFNYNADDGIFLGGGFFFTKHGFRKDPYASQHFFLGSVALRTLSWDFKYRGSFTNVIGNLDLKVNLLAQSPRFVTPFFGLGNETVFDQNIDDIKNTDSAIEYYRLRYIHYSTELFLHKNLGTKSYMSFGPHWQGFETQSDYDGEDRFILDYADSIGDQTIFDFKTYAGLAFKIGYDSRDSKTVTKQGIHIDVDLRGYNGLNEISNRFTRTHATIAFYYSLRLPSTVTMAVRFGGGSNRGSYEYYQGQILSGPVHLRGYRRTRFVGDESLYGNAELRFHIAKIRNRLIPTRVGLHAFYDAGRVWVSGESSDSVHRGGGGGIWFAPLDAAVIALELAGSEEGTRFYIRTGFMF